MKMTWEEWTVQRLQIETTTEEAAEASEIAVAVEPRSMNRQKLPPVNDLQKLVVLWIRVHQRAHVSGGLLGLKKRAVMTMMTSAQTVLRWVPMTIRAFELQSRAPISHLKLKSARKGIASSNARIAISTITSRNVSPCS